jgi:hypothetical protein
MLHGFSDSDRLVVKTKSMLGVLIQLLAVSVVTLYPNDGGR